MSEGFLNSRFYFMHPTHIRFVKIGKILPNENKLLMSLELGMARTSVTISLAMKQTQSQERCWHAWRITKGCNCVLIGGLCPEEMELMSRASEAIYLRNTFSFLWLVGCLAAIFECLARPIGMPGVWLSELVPAKVVGYSSIVLCVLFLVPLCNDNISLDPF